MLAGLILAHLVGVDVSSRPRWRPNAVCVERSAHEPLSRTATRLEKGRLVRHARRVHRAGRSAAASYAARPRLSRRPEIRQQALGIWASCNELAFILGPTLGALQDDRSILLVFAARWSAAWENYNSLEPPGLAIMQNEGAAVQLSNVARDAQSQSCTAGLPAAGSV